jgi:hypothetical protein
VLHAIITGLERLRQEKRVQDQPGLHGQTLPQKIKINNV